MYSHHSHSGDYVAHAKDSLDDIVERAYSLGFKTYCLTEHMPRFDIKLLYPEEEEQNFTLETLAGKFDSYVKHARLIQDQYEGRMDILVGCEVEGVDFQHISRTKELVEKYRLEMLVGSCHHVHSIPIDFDSEKWMDACKKSGSVEQLYIDFFNLQYEIITILKPSVIGHFDLIRLFDPNPSSDLSLNQEIWKLVVRNLDAVNSYGGLIELNSAAIRKGWTTPYPGRDIVAQGLKMGSRFCLSDDAHSVEQVGLNYEKVMEYVTNMGIELHYLKRQNGKTAVCKVCKA